MQKTRKMVVVRYIRQRVSHCWIFLMVVSHFIWTKIEYFHYIFISVKIMNRKLILTFRGYLWLKKKNSLQPLFPIRFPTSPNLHLDYRDTLYKGINTEKSMHTHTRTFLFVSTFECFTSGRREKKSNEMCFELQQYWFTEIFSKGF